MMINETTERLTPISFLIGSTFHDNILEGQEKFGLRVLPSNSLQVGQNSFVTIHILDATGINYCLLYIAYLYMIELHMHQ